MSPNRPIRRSQLISPFGVGSIVDFRGSDSLMTAGLDAWPLAFESPENCEELVIVEERLQSRLNVSHFRYPVTCDEKGGPHQNKIPFVRFPSWHYCPDCGLMLELGINGSRSRCNSTECSKRPPYHRPWVIPVRIIAVCRLGHITDFPFREWAHRHSVRNPLDHELTWKARGASSALSGVVISCSCGNASRSLEGSFTFRPDEGGALHKLGVDCPGARPWFLDSGSENKCGEFLRAVQRGASNVYFAATKSSIYLPTGEFEDSEIIAKTVEQLVNKLREKPKEKWDTFIEVTADSKNIPVQKLSSAVMKRLQPGRQSKQYESEEEFRFEEFSILSDTDLNPGSELVMEEIPISRYGNLQRYFERIRLVKKLRETRALYGFSRLAPSDDGKGAPVQDLKLDPEIDWLPAVIVRGEGIFIEFKKEAFELWLQSFDEIQQRADRHKHVFSESLSKKINTIDSVTPMFMLIHTFAHLLIRELVYECGYGSASLRERIYCTNENSTVEDMYGLLIYTASGDADGTMGGLVRQGKPERFIETLKSALNRATWCAIDPVCIESNGQGTNNANLAACHSCALIPETSCEMQNRILDRAMVVGSPQQPELGFFRDLLW